MLYSIGNFDLLSVGIVCAGMGLLGFGIFFSDRKSVSNKSFFLFTLVSIVWGIVNFFSYKLNESQSILWILRAEIFLGVWHSFSLYLFILVFPRQQHNFSKKFTFILLPVVIFVSVLTLTPIMFQNINHFVGTGEVSTVSKGPGTLLFVLLVVFLLIGSFSNLIKKIRHSQAEEKIQLSTVFYGLIITFFLIATFNFLLPSLFDYLYLAPLGAVFIFPFIAFTFYAVYKYKFFNLRAAFIAGITFMLSVAAFLEIIFSSSGTLIFLRTAVFLLVLAISIMMNRFVETIAEQREALQKANEGQENLIHVMNHQIKGYLAKARNIFSELLTDPGYGAVTERSRPMIEEGFKSLTEGVGFVQEILSGSSAQSGTITYNMQPFDFKNLVLETAEKEKGRAEEKKLSYEISVADEDYKIKGDKTQLEQAVRNLIDNSIIYTKLGGLKINLFKSNNGGNNIVLNVKDTGIGLDPEDKPRLFTKGGKGRDSLKVNVNSSGYGLAFVKGVIEAHKGRVWAQSEGPGKGSTFSLELPTG